MKISHVLACLVLAGCVSNLERRAPAQVGASATASWDDDLKVKEAQLREEDKLRREQPRDAAFRTENLKKGFPISMKIVGEPSVTSENLNYQKLCFTRIVEEFLDFQANTRLINEYPDKNIIISDLRGWASTRNYFNFRVTDANNMSYTGRVFVKFGVEAGYYLCKAIAGKGYEMIEMKSPDEQIYPIKK